MNIKRAWHLLTALVVAFGLVGIAAAAPKKANHHDGKALLGDKVKAKGQHVIDKKGDYSVAADVKDGKIAGVHVKHAKKGDIAVKKYKSNKKVAQIDGAQPPAIAADDYIGTMWIGYAYIDDDGYEQIYWFPYDMILDGDTGAFEYIPAS